MAQLHLIETGSGAPLVLLHAFPLNSSMWAAQVEALGDSWRVICPDQRGFGGSLLPDADVDAAPSLDALADDLAELLDARRISEPVVLAGLSMGGYVVMAFWRRHRERVRALVLADTKASADSPEAAAGRERIAAEVVSAASSAQLVDELTPTLLGSTTRSERPLVLGRVKALVESAPPDAVAWAQRAMAARPDSFADLRTVDVPALVIVGVEDAISPPADARAMADAMPGARLVQIPAAGHLSAIEAPDDFNAALGSFLDQLR
ncbi:MAG: alpha/beta hydrolase [Mycobacteriales bacterium]